MACTVLPIQKVACGNSRAGIRKLYVIAAAKVSGLTFGTGGVITAITVVSGGLFVPIEMKLNTAFFNQEKKRAGGKGAVHVSQKIQFNLEGLLSDYDTALAALNECCDLHVIVKTNGGQLFYAGISKDGIGFVSEEMRTGDGFANTGANPESDEAQYQETLDCMTRWYAPQFTGLESAIPIT